ncbi:MAG TPA: SRPBCC family protein [Phycisphaerae bacterium]|nr:SRPBCC family protein [Phycisphaerae bacterium]HRW54846.1 SRPBCC family protein [Phycisphaerae bacterium]
MPETHTIRLHCVLRAPAERVYRAFLDPDAMVKWIPPHGFTGNVHSMDARVGGSHRMSFTNFSTGESHSFGGTYVELTPHSKIRYTDKFDDPNLSGEMQVTISLRDVLCGTDLEITQEGVPAVIPAEMCYLGWQESLAMLKLLVEAEVPSESA